LVWRGLRVSLTAGNVLLVGGLTWLAVSFQLATAFFDAPLPLEQRLNRTMAAKQAGGEMREVVVEYHPSQRARSLVLVFNFAGPDTDFAALRLGGGPGFPPAWLNYRAGTPFEIIPVPGARAGGEFTVAFSDGRAEVRRDETLLLATRFRLRSDRFAVAAYPAHVMQFLRPQLAAIENLTLVTDIGPVHALSARWRGLIAAAAALLAALVYMVGDRVLAAGLRKLGERSRGPATLLATFPAWPWLAVLGAVSLSIAQDQAWRHDVSATWFGAHVEDGRFAAEAFRDRPELIKKGEVLRVDLAPSVDHIVAFGGSTTHGIPYGRERYAWPAQLTEILRERAARPNRRWDVDNLGFAGNYLETNFPPVADDFLREVRPRAVVIHSLFNEYLKERPWDNVWQAVGFAGRQSPDEPGVRERYLDELGAVIDRMRAIAPIVAVIEPPVDRLFYDGNPLREWQEAMCEVAAAHGAVVIRLQDAFDALDDRFVFYEYIHLTVAGNRRVAVAVFNALEPYLMEVD